MKTSIVQVLKRRVSILLVVAMVVSLLPVTNVQEAMAYTATKALNEGADIFQTARNGEWDHVFFGQYYQGVSHPSIPLSWRILSTTPNGSVSRVNGDAYSGKSFFLLSDYAIVDRKFCKTVSSGTASANWLDSSVREWLQSDTGFYSSSNFTDLEKSRMLETNKDEIDTYEDYLAPSDLSEDTFFLPSAQEVKDGVNGFIDYQNRKAVGLDEGSKPWSLRNKDVTDGKTVNYGYVTGAINNEDSNGRISTTTDTDTHKNPFVRPACNIAIEDIMYTSTIEGKPGFSEDNKKIEAIPDVDTRHPNTRDYVTWKFTMKNYYSGDNLNGQNVSVNEAETYRNVNDVTITYSDAKYGTNQYLSVLIYDKDDKLFGYRKIKHVSDNSVESGTATFTLPDEYTDDGGWKVYVCSEEAYNGGRTDYMSEPKQIAIPLCTVTSVDITPQTVSVNRPATVSFSAHVNGSPELTLSLIPKYTPSQRTTWSIENQTSAGTTISSDSISSAQLTIASDETAKTIKVIATSVDKKTIVNYVNVTIYRKLIFDLDGGTCSREIVSVNNLIPDTIYTLPETTDRGGTYPLKRGKATFYGWYTEPKGMGTRYDNDENKLVVSQDMILYAAWETNSGTGAFRVNDPGNQMYTGKAIKPIVTVYHDDEKEPLVLGKDYTVTYSNNTNVASRTSAAAPTITVKGKGNFQQSETIRFTISPKPITVSDISITCADKEYTGKAITSDPIVKWGTKKLQKGKDYTFKYIEDETARIGTDNSVSECHVSVTGIGNFTGTKMMTFRIVPKGKQLSAKSIVVDKIANQTYTGRPITLEGKPSTSPTLVVRDGSTELEEGTDYKIVYPAEHTKVGKVKATLVGMGNYGGEKTIKFNIVAKALNADKKGTYAPGISVNNLSNQNNYQNVSHPKNIHYTGAPITMRSGGIIVSYDNGDTSVNDSTVILNYQTDFTVKYTNNINVNTKKVADVLAMSESKEKTAAIKKLPTAIITGKGNYTGTIKAYFDILPAELNEDNFIIDVPEVEAKKGRNGAYIPAQFKAKNIKIRHRGSYTDDKVSSKDYYIAGYKNNTGKPIDVVKGVSTNAIVIISANSAQNANLVSYCEIPFRIYSKKDVSKNPITVSVTADAYHPNMVYDGSAYRQSHGLLLNIIDTSRNHETKPGQKYELEWNKDYTLKYKNNVNAAKSNAPKPPTVIISGKGSYSGTREVKFTINPRSLKVSNNGITVEVADGLFINNQTAITPKVKVTYTPNSWEKPIVLKAGKDYTLTYKKNNSKGEKPNGPYAIVKGIGNYIDSINAPFRIYGTDIKKAVTTKIPAHIYTGKQIKPTVSDMKVYYQDKELKLDVDYSVRYGENIKAGIGRVYIDGKGAYGGTKTIKFTILPKWLSWIVGGDVDTTEPTEQSPQPGTPADQTWYPIPGSSDKITNMTLVENSNTDIIPGESKEFTAKVTGVAGISKNVIWYVVEAKSPKTRVETIKYNETTGETVGKLTIGDDETSTSISIQAFSAEDTGAFVGKEVKISKVYTFDATYVYQNGVSGNVYTSDRLAAYDTPLLKDEQENYVTDEHGVKVLFKDLMPVKIVGVTKAYDHPYEFIGWFTEPDGQGKPYPGDSTDRKFYAAWSSRRLGEYSIMDIEQQTYTGSKITPSVTIFDGKSRLQLGKDYSVTYKNNVNVGSISNANAPSIVVKGKSNYVKNEVIAFTIAPKSISDNDVSVTCVDKTYTGKTEAINSDPIIKYGKKKLKKNKDFVVNYDISPNCKATDSSAKQVKMTITGIGNYSGTCEASYIISSKARTLDKAKIATIPSKTYNGYPLKLTSADMNMSRKVTLNGTNLTYGTDYDIQYAKEPVNAGTVKASIVGRRVIDNSLLGKYGGTKAFTYKIQPKSIKTVSIDAIPAQLYKKGGVTLDEHTLVVRDYAISENGAAKVLKPGVDYSVTYKNNDAKSRFTYEWVKGITDKKDQQDKLDQIPTVIIKGIGNYSNSIKTYFDINAQSMESSSITVTVQDVKASFRKGKVKPVTPKVVVKDGDKVLTENINYTLKVSNNTVISDKYPVTVSTPYVVVTAGANYTKSRTVYYSIYKQDAISKENRVTYTVPGSFVYNGTAHKPEPVLTDSSISINAAGDPYVLQKNIDYKITGYKNNVKAGSATVSGSSVPSISIKGMGRYSGNMTCTFDISPKTITADMVTASDVQIKEGKANADPIVTVMDGKKKLKEGKDYVVSLDVSNEAAPKVIVTGINNYTSNGEKNFYYYKTSITEAKTSKIPVQFYNGKGLTPNVTVYYNGEILTNGTDYTLQYSNNAKIGKGKINIIGKADKNGEFGGIKTVTFRILPKWLSWIVD